MKLVILLMLMLPLTACHISRGFQPPPEGYKGYYKKRYNDVPPEIIKRDMLNCGFPNVYSNAQMLNNDLENYTKATICMEQLGYNTTDSRGVTCSFKLFKTTEACQKYLNQK